MTERCERCWELERRSSRLEDEVQRLNRELSTAEREASRVPGLSRTVKQFEDARAASAIPCPDPGPVEVAVGEFVDRIRDQADAIQAAIDSGADPHVSLDSKRARVEVLRSVSNSLEGILEG